MNKQNKITKCNIFSFVSYGRCGLARRLNRIVGGAVTEVNEYPWQVKYIIDK